MHLPKLSFLWRKLKLLLVCCTGAACLVYYASNHGFKPRSNNPTKRIDDKTVGAFALTSECIDGSDRVFSLDLGGSDWSVRNENGSAVVAADGKVKVPGGIYSDLIRANVLKKGDVYYRYSKSKSKSFNNEST